jgi:hypothetical protein
VRVCLAGADLCTSAGSYGSVVVYVRTVKTSSGATAVQIVCSSRRGHARSSISVRLTMRPNREDQYAGRRKAGAYPSR